MNRSCVRSISLCCISANGDLVNIDSNLTAEKLTDQVMMTMTLNAAQELPAVNRRTGNCATDGMAPSSSHLKGYETFLMNKMY